MKCKTAAMVFFLTIVFLVGGCSSGKDQKKASPEYTAKIKEWHQKRLAGLKTPGSWLSLAGLFWLEEGENTFGGAKTNTLVISDVPAPETLGVFIKTKQQVLFKAAEGQSIGHEGKKITEIPLESDVKGKPTILTHGTLSWYLIDRDGRLGVRLKDSKNPKIEQLKEIPTFPIDPAWKTDAVLERFEKPKMIDTPTVLGSVIQQPAPGKLVFKIGGKSYSLVPFGGSGDLFVIFGDTTNGMETYGGGRFLSVKKPDEQGRTEIDFNMAFNPPCVFSEYATCPMPPEVNRLTARITAGEKMVAGLGHH